MQDTNIIPHDLWTVKLNFHCTLAGALPEKIASALEDVAVSVFLHNKEATDGDNWSVTLTTMGPPDKDGILVRLTVLAEEEGLPPLLTISDIIAEKLPEKDWLRHVHENFPPIHTDMFFIYGSHYTGDIPTGLIPLQIDAATAFGSGEHETTRGCLMALEKLKKEGRTFKSALDMGCGSGILAIAFAKLWPGIPVAAVDIDPESVTVTRRHVEMNGVSTLVTAEAGDGYNTPLVGKKAPFDIILANILANPLIQMAPDLSRVLLTGGYAVLSGLLKRQKDEVVAAHEALGLALVHIDEIGTAETGLWQALTLRK